MRSASSIGERTQRMRGSSPPCSGLAVSIMPREKSTPGNRPAVPQAVSRASASVTIG